MFLAACALTLGLHVVPWASTTSPRSRPLRLSAAAGDPAELRESAASEREVALAQREQAAREREEAVALRERAAGKREEALRGRELFGNLNASRPDLNAVAAKIEAKVTAKIKSRRRVATLAEFEQAVADGFGYKSMDIRGDSGALAPRPDAPAPAAAHPVVAALHRRAAQVASACRSVWQHTYLLRPMCGHPSIPGCNPYASQGSRAGERQDGMKIALAIEGGGMRGCVAAGMAAALSELGLLESFDAVYGASAGSLIGAYLLSGQDYRFGCSGERPYAPLCTSAPCEP